MEFTNQESLKNLIHGYLSNQASKEDLKELQIWIDQSDDNKKQFIELSRVWMLTSQASSRGKFNKAKYDEWNKLSGKIAGKGKNMRRIPISSLQKAMMIAALFLLLFSTGVTIAWIITSQRLQNLISMETTHQISAPLGGKSEVILPDGSMVKLNAGSKISYSNNFGYSERSILLEGEGYFEVKTNPEIPFVVNVSDLKIKAYGTIFNVKAYPEEEIVTTLIEGVVKIEGENIDLTMTPSQKVTYIKGQYRHVNPEKDKVGTEAEKLSSQENLEIIEPPKIRLASNVNTREITAWKDGQFIFNSEKLSHLAVILERKYDVSIDIQSEELKNHKFTGAFHQETLEQILGIINLSAPIKYKIEKGVVSIQLDTKRRAIFEEVSVN